MSLQFTYQSGIYVLKTKQTIHAPLNEVWSFFSTPKNLNALTPSDMAFQVTSGNVDRMYQGQIISYQIEILPKIKQSWVTEITHVSNQEFFVDEQRFGPYAMWHHEHHFEEVDAHTTQMNDIVSYKLPLGYLGTLITGKAIQNRVKTIFEYRERAVNEIFVCDKKAVTF